MAENSISENGKRGNDHELGLLIKTPNGDWSTTFLKTSKVKDVIDAIVVHFNYAKNGKYELRLESDPNTVLKPERPLVSYGITDGTVLVFIDYGAAV